MWTMCLNGRGFVKLLRGWTEVLWALAWSNKDLEHWTRWLWWVWKACLNFKLDRKGIDNLPRMSGRKTTNLSIILHFLLEQTLYEQIISSLNSTV